MGASVGGPRGPTVHFDAPVTQPVGPFGAGTPPVDSSLASGTIVGRGGGRTTGQHQCEVKKRDACLGPDTLRRFDSAFRNRVGYGWDRVSRKHCPDFGEALIEEVVHKDPRIAVDSCQSCDCT